MLRPTYKDVALVQAVESKEKVDTSVSCKLVDLSPARHVEAHCLGVWPLLCYRALGWVANLVHLSYHNVAWGCELAKRAVCSVYEGAIVSYNSVLWRATHPQRGWCQCSH